MKSDKYLEFNCSWCKIRKKNAAHIHIPGYLNSLVCMYFFVCRKKGSLRVSYK